MNRNSNGTCLSLLVFLVCLSSPVGMLYGQTPTVSFSNQSALISPNVYSGAAIGVSDMNGDGKDDIVHLDNRRILYISYQNNPNQVFSSQNYGQLNSGSEWAMCIADVDRNGINDMLAGGNSNQLKLVKGDAQGNFSTTFIPYSNFFCTRE